MLSMTYRPEFLVAMVVLKLRRCSHALQVFLLAVLLDRHFGVVLPVNVPRVFPIHTQLAVRMVAWVASLVASAFLGVP